METRDPINSGLANPPTPSHPTPLNSPLRIFLPALAVLVRTRALTLAPPLVLGHFRSYLLFRDGWIH